MAQPKPDRRSVEEILKLVEQLSLDEQEALLEEMKLHSLRRELQKAEDELRRGDGVPAEDVLAELRERNKTFRRKGQVD